MYINACIYVCMPHACLVPADARSSSCWVGISHTVNRPTDVWSGFRVLCPHSAAPCLRDAYTGMLRAYWVVTMVKWTQKRGVMCSKAGGAFQADLKPGRTVRAGAGQICLGGWDEIRAGLSGETAQRSVRQLVIADAGHLIS